MHSACVTIQGKFVFNKLLKFKELIYNPNQCYNLKILRFDLKLTPQYDLKIFTALTISYRLLYLDYFPVSTIHPFYFLFSPPEIQNHKVLGFLGSRDLITDSR